jgi:hypothetical protein
MVRDVLSDGTQMARRRGVSNRKAPATRDGAWCSRGGGTTCTTRRGKAQHTGIGEHSPEAHNDLSHGSLTQGPEAPGAARRTSRSRLEYPERAGGRQGAERAGGQADGRTVDRRQRSGSRRALSHSRRPQKFPGGRVTVALHETGLGRGSGSLSGAPSGWGSGRGGGAGRRDGSPGSGKGDGCGSGWGIVIGMAPGEQSVITDVHCGSCPLSARVARTGEGFERIRSG